MRSSIYLFAILLIVNILLFIFRNKGFEYRKYATRDSICIESDANSKGKWQKSNARYSKAELSEAKSLMDKIIKPDSYSTTEEKALQLGCWLYNQFQNTGEVNSRYMGEMPVLEQFHTVVRNNEQISCGKYQLFFGFFCTALGIENRYLELIPSSRNAGDNHSLNEIYLPELKNWVMVDITRNKLMIRQNKKLICAAEYYDLTNSRGNDSIEILKSGNTSCAESNFQKAGNDNYFKEPYSIFYYYQSDLSNIYSFKEKITRYFFAKPWYETYSGLEKKSNTLFHLRQIAATLLLLSFLISTLLILKKIRQKPHKKPNPNSTIL